MQRYDSYKDSGIQWLGQIPGHWEVKSLRSFIRLFTEKGYGKAQLLSVTRERGVIERNKDDKEENHNFIPEDLSGYKHILPGDFVINKMKSWQGSYGVSAYEGIVSPAYFTCKLSNVEKDYFSLAIRSKAYVPFFTQYSKGIRVDQWDLDPIALMKIPFFLPPRAEQKAIVTYLDGETEKIDSFISSKEKEIRLLEELKQAEIANAVTRGLHPNVPMKDSGITWLGDIPAHWEVKRVRVIANSIFKGNGITKDMVYLDGDTPCVRYGEIYSKYSHSFTNALSKTNLAEITSPRFVSYGDALCAGTGELVDEIGKSIVYLGKDECLVGGDIVVISHSQDPAFFNYAFNSNYAQLQKSVGKSKLKVVHISGFELANVRLALPPLAEQKEIVEYLDRKCANIDKMISNIEQEITQLKEYKQRLIADAVTGQIKVC